jgi:FlaA1/EpsC-like NDP-sugar epimerase
VFLGRTETGEDTLDGLYGLDTYVGKSVLVSGAGGSIGSELCRQLIHLRPGRLILFDLSEVALFDVHRTLLQTASAAQVELVPVLGSVTDGMLVAQVLAQQSVDIVLHAAAYKHVSLVQRNPLVGLSNNALGTHVLTTAAVQAGVERFILVSSDKAMRPSGVMGVSKRLAELIVQDIAHRMGDDGPILSIVRFGNVLGSSGSVVPIFQDQISRGGPVTVTDPHATRYFMTVSEAGRLVLYAGAMSRGGEIFVLDMGKPVRILDLALQAIVAAGRTIRSPKVPYGEIAVEIVGLCEGENRHEQALCDGTEKATAHHRIFCLEDAGLSEFEVAEILRSLRNAIASGQPEEAFSALARRIPGFRNPTDPEETLPIAHIS